MVEQRLLFLSVEHPSGQLGEVCFEWLVGGCSRVHHREKAGRSGCDGFFWVGSVNSESTKRIRRNGERFQPDLPTKPVQGVGVLLSRCFSQIPVISR